MKPNLEERETVINFGRLDKTASVYTSVETVMTKLDKFVKQDTGWKLKDSDTCQGDLVSKTYECPVEFISFRSKKVTRELTEEQRARMAERARQIFKNKPSATIQESTAET